MNNHVTTCPVWITGDGNAVCTCMTEQEILKQIEHIRKCYYNHVSPDDGTRYDGYGSMNSEKFTRNMLALIGEAERMARVDELKRKMTLNLELMSSADFKAGFNEALDQIDRANGKRIAELTTSKEVNDL